MAARVVDRHRFDADPDSTFYFNADLDPTLKLGQVNPFLSIIFRAPVLPWQAIGIWILEYPVEIFTDLSPNNLLFWIRPQELDK